jgi:hypothetical protein
MFTRLLLGSVLGLTLIAFSPAASVNARRTCSVAVSDQLLQSLLEAIPVAALNCGS